MRKHLLLASAAVIGAFLFAGTADAVVISGPLTSAQLMALNTGASYGPPSPAHFTEPGPITVTSGTATPLFTGPNYGNIDSILLVISAPSIPVGNIITLTYNGLAPITFTAADFSNGGFPTGNIPGLGNGQVNGVVFPTSLHAAADLTSLPTGLPTDAFLANVTISQTIATNLRIDVFGDLNGRIVNNAANSGALGVTGFSPPPVPEPATLTLLGAGLLGLWGVRRRWTA